MRYLFRTVAVTAFLCAIAGATCAAANTDALYEQARNYQYGLGVDKDVQEAVRLYRLAAEGGNADAQYALATLVYSLGQPAKDQPPSAEAGAEAISWFQAAAQQGHPAAQSTLGRMYGYGDSVDVDRIKGVMWLMVAQASGSRVKSTIRRMERRMEPDDIAKAGQLAKACTASGFQDCD